MPISRNLEEVTMNLSLDKEGLRLSVNSHQFFLQAYVVLKLVWKMGKGEKRNETREE